MKKGHGFKSRLITIARFTFSIEEEIAKNKLKSAGIQTFVADDNLINANWLYSNAIGGVKLRVRLVDRERAIALLKKEINDDLDEDSSNYNECPQCRLKFIYYQKFNRRIAFLSWLLLGVPFPLKKWKCVHSSFEWSGRNKA